MLADLGAEDLNPSAAAEGAEAEGACLADGSMLKSLQGLQPEPVWQAGAADYGAPLMSKSYSAANPLPPGPKLASCSSATALGSSCWRCASNPAGLQPNRERICCIQTSSDTSVARLYSPRGSDPGLLAVPGAKY